MNTKTRTTAVHPSLGENRRLTFYAALFNVEAVVFDRADPVNDQKVKYKERVLPGAFDDTLARPDYDVVATIDHDKARTFARVSTGELLLQPDPYGLFCSCYLPDSEIGDHVWKEVKAGRLVGTSFRYSAFKERWRTDGPMLECDLEAAVLEDVCLTSTPAYPTKGEVHLRNNVDRVRLAFTRLRLAKIRQRGLHTDVV